MKAVFSAILALLILIPATSWAQESVARPRLHLKSDAGTKDSGGDDAVNGENIATWQDQSGNGFDVTQGIDGRRPSLETGGLNGLNLVRFDGIDERFTGSVAISNMITGSAWTAFCVFNAETVNTNSGTSYSNDTPFTDTGGFFGLHVRSNGTLYGYNWDGTDDRASTTYTVGTPLIAMFRLSGGFLYLQKENGTETNVATGNTMTLTNFLNVGRSWNTGAHQLDGTIGEILIFNTNLSAIDRLFYHNYLSSKWNIALFDGDRYAYDADGFDFDVWGVGQMSTDTITVATSDVITLFAPTALQSGDFALLGHDGTDRTLWTQTNVPENSKAGRISREWRLDATNSPGSLSVSVDATDLPAITVGDHYYLFISPTGTFSDGQTTRVRLERQSGNLWQVRNLQIPDGSFMTIGVADLSQTLLALPKEENEFLACLLADGRAFDEGLLFLMLSMSALAVTCRIILIQASSS